MMLNYVCLVLASTLCPALSHVVLTFPPARYPQLDFIDTIRADGPCGVPKMPDKAIITTLEPGSPVNVTWRMGYAHLGGFRIELLDEGGNVLQMLTPQSDSNFVGDSDQTGTSYTVTLPESECRSCILRLTRQATEWGENYQFRSCADIHVVRDDAIGPLSGCFAHGEITSEGDQPRCVCRPPYFGQYCHLMEDCMSDADCNDRGSCVQMDSSMERKNRCYCKPPFFGKNCQLEFTPTDEERNSNCFQYDFSQETSLEAIYNPSCYQTVDLEGDDKLMYRIVGDQMEFVMSFTSGTWMAVGWRPSDITPACYDFPVPKGDNSPTNLHPMDCTDIVVGRVHGDRMSNVGDYYTRDKSTPLADSVYEGTDSLSAAAGFRNGRKTVVMFRKPIAATERADHSLNGERTFVIWAKGMEPGQYSFNTKSAVDDGEAGDKMFYKVNELMYHGNRNRGVTIVSFMGENYIGDGNSVGEPHGEPEGEPVPTGEHTYPEAEPVVPAGEPSWPEHEPEPEPKAEVKPEPENAANWPADTEPHGENQSPQYEDPNGQAEPESEVEAHPGAATSIIPSLLVVLLSWAVAAWLRN